MYEKIMQNIVHLMVNYNREYKKNWHKNGCSWKCDSVYLCSQSKINLEKKWHLTELEVSKLQKYKTVFL